MGGTVDRFGKGLIATVTAAAFCLALALPAGAVAPTKSIEVGSSVTLAASHNSGLVRSGEPACVAERSVVVKYRDKQGKVRIFGRDTTDEVGKYFIGEISAPEGTSPFEFFAVAKARTDEGKGRGLTCTEAKSKVRVVEGS
jgi:hypothetical protein